MQRRGSHQGRGFLAALLVLCAGILVLFPGISMAATPGGTEITNVASSTFSYGGNNYVEASVQTTVTVNTVASVTVQSDESGYIQAGKSKSYTHTVTNNGNSTDTIDLEAASSLGFTIELLASDGTTPLTDTDSDGKIDTGPISSGSGIDIVVRLTAPADAEPGEVDTTVLTATSSNDPSVTEEVTHTTTVLKAKFWDPLEKSVDPPGQVTQDTTITYTNTFGNAGNIAATNVVITDTLDDNLIYIEGSATEPAGISGTVITYDPYTRELTWIIPSIPAGYTGQVSFKARIDPEAPSDATVDNAISFTSDQTPTRQISNTVTSTIVEQPLRITKSADRDVAEIGDHITYTVTVENVSTSMTAGQVKIRDSLPHGFRYLEGSTTLDDADFNDPAMGTSPEWHLGSMAPGDRKVLKYRAIVSIDAPLGKGTNTATVTGKSTGGNDLDAGPANATVKVKEGILNSRTIILGRVFLDENRDMMPDREEPGIKGVRVYIEDGSYAVTDGEGRFSIYGVTAGEHVLKLDPNTVPEGYVSVPIDSTFAGDGDSRFISAPYGGAARGDFALVPATRDGGKDAAATRTDRNDGGERKGKKKYTFSAGHGREGLPLEKRIQSMPKTAEILEPSDGERLERAWSDIVVRVAEGTEHTIRVNGLPVPEKNIGKVIHETRRGIIINRYVGVALRPGPNTITIEVRSETGRRTTKEIKVTAPGPPERLAIFPDKADIPADGRTTVPFTVRVLDRWNGPSMEEGIVTVVTKKGVILDDDLDPSTPGHQIRYRNGMARFRLRSTLKTGSDEVGVLLGGELDAKADVYFTPELREWVVVGLGELTAGKRDVSGYVEKIAGGDDFDEGIYHDGRLAFFAKGKILGKYLLTASYDSDKEERDELFSQVDPDRYYPVYGDAGEIGYEAESQRKLYVKIERGRSSVIFGDYHTDLSRNEFARYTRTFNGLKADMETPVFTFKGFGAYTHQTVTRDELQANGTSGYYFLAKPPLIENSETIRIEVRDRYHPERVISWVEKARYTDYTINYSSGTVLFKEPVPSTDDELNPVYIVATYESEDAGEKYYIYGARAGIRPTEGSELGLTAVVEEQDLEDTTMIGADLRLGVAHGTELRAEVARSDTLEAGLDDAWKVELTSRPNDKIKLDLYYRDVGRDFRNTSMTGSETGTKKYGAKADYRATERTAVRAYSFVHDDKTNRTRLRSDSIGLVHRFNRATVETGYKELRERTGSPSDGDKSSALIYTGVGLRLTDKLSASVDREQVITSDEIEDYQTKTLLRLDYRLGGTTKAYLTQEFQDGKYDKTDTTLVGIESRVTESTAISSRYRIEDTVSGQRAQASIGLNNRWEVNEGLTLNTVAERTQSVRGSGTDNTALALSAEYLVEKEIKVTGRYELRFGEDETARLYNLGAVLKLREGVSLIGKMNLWTSDKDSGNDLLFDGLTGIAYRPLGKRSIYLLSTLRYKADRQGSSGTNNETRSLISSTEFSYRVRPRWTVVGKYAGKYSLEDYGGKGFESYTDLVLAGLRYDITERWNTSFHAKLMNQYQTRMRSSGCVVKVSYMIRKNFYAGVGYNHSEMNDRDLDGADYTARGLFFDLKFKFDEGLLRQ